MHPSYHLTLLLFIASALAISVTSPSQGTLWSDSGPNTVTWNEVSTDPKTFAITLVQLGVFKQILADNVDGTKGGLTITSHLPVGSGYQVNIVKSAQEVNSILAQSAQFNISQGASSSGTVSGTITGVSSSSNAASSASTEKPGGSGFPTGTAPPSSSSSIVSLQPSQTSAAFQRMSIMPCVGLMVMFTLIIFTAL